MLGSDQGRLLLGMLSGKYAAALVQSCAGGCQPVGMLVPGAGFERAAAQVLFSLQPGALLLALPHFALNRIGSLATLGHFLLGALQRCAQLLQPCSQRCALGNQRGKFALRILAARLELTQPLLGNRQFAADTFGLAVYFAALGMEGGKPGAPFTLERAHRLDRLAEAGEFGLTLLDCLAQCLFGVVMLFDIAQGSVPAEAMPVAQQRLQVAGDLVTFLGTFGLAPKIAEPRAQLGDNILHAGQVLLRRFQAAHRRGALDLVAADPRRLLEERAALFGRHAQRTVDQPLADDGVGTLAQPGLREEIDDILQAHPLAIDDVFVVAVAIGAPRHLDLGEVDGNLAGAVVQRDGDLGQVETRLFVAAREDDVTRLARAQQAEALLAQTPAHCIDNVALAAAVRADDGRHPRVKDELGAAGKRLEALDNDALDSHGRN